jgi:hypothetical protein
VLGGVALTAACSSDAVTAPVAIVQPSLEGLQADAMVPLGMRLESLAQDTTVQAVIGEAGGILRIDNLGFQLIVPRGAVAQPTTFTVTALAGRGLAYEFAPRGVEFNAPLIFRQDRRVTGIAWGEDVSAARFSGTYTMDEDGLRAKVDGRMPARWRGSWIEFGIRRASGYLVSSA